MKKYILVLFGIFTWNSFAQFTTVDMFNTPESIGFSENGYYYKDVTGYFNQFLGTWKYQDATTTYILEFEKRTFTESLSHVNKTFMYDDLIGALKVIKNGVVVYDDLATLDQNYSDAVKYNISLGIRAENFNDCYMCTYPEQRLGLSYNEPDNDNYAFSHLGILIHTYQQNNTVKLRLVFRQDQVNPDEFFTIEDTQTAPVKTQLFLPFGTYDFVKVP